jgi:hypothetical protein
MIRFDANNLPITYYGNYKNDMKHGFGKCTFSSGDWLESTYEKGNLNVILKYLFIIII